MLRSMVEEEDEELYSNREEVCFDLMTYRARNKSYQGTLDRPGPPYAAAAPGID